MAYTNPQVGDFKAYFIRDFPYGGTDGDLTTVQDGDIQNALTDVLMNINSSLFPSQLLYTNGFLLLAAHYLVMNLRAGAQGIQGQYPWMVTSKSGGGLSDSSVIPQYMMNNPYILQLTKTYYGAKYINLVLPQLVAPCFSVRGKTHA